MASSPSCQPISEEPAGRRCAGWCLKRACAGRRGDLQTRPVRILEEDPTGIPSLGVCHCSVIDEPGARRPQPALGGSHFVHGIDGEGEVMKSGSGGAELTAGLLPERQEQTRPVAEERELVFTFSGAADVLKAQRIGVEGAGALKVCDVDADVSGDE